MYGIRKTTTSGGLTTKTGLLPSAKTALGDVRDVVTGTPSAPTGLELALENADYTYAATGSTSKLTQALDKFEAWQKIALTAEAMKVACWKDKASGQTNFASPRDLVSTTCAVGVDVGTAAALTPTVTLLFNPIMQAHGAVQLDSAPNQNTWTAKGAAVADTQSAKNTAAVAAQDGFGVSGNANNKEITATQMSNRAKA